MVLVARFGAALLCDKRESCSRERSSSRGGRAGRTTQRVRLNQLVGQRSAGVKADFTRLRDITASIQLSRLRSSILGIVASGPRVGNLLHARVPAHFVTRQLLRFRSIQATCFHLAKQSPDILATGDQVFGRSTSDPGTQQPLPGYKSYIGHF